MKKTAALMLALMVTAPLALAGDGEAIYNKKCAACHGKDGKGDTKMGKKKGARDYTDAAVQASYTDEEGVKAILDGVEADGKTVMKGAKGKITEAEAKAIIAYMRSFQK